jgi:hypothetical protein
LLKIAECQPPHLNKPNDDYYVSNVRHLPLNSNNNAPAPWRSISAANRCGVMLATSLCIYRYAVKLIHELFAAMPYPDNNFTCQYSHRFDEINACGLSVGMHKHAFG